MAAIKLSKKQQEVLSKMVSGIRFYYNPVTNDPPCTEGRYGTGAKKVNAKIMSALLQGKYVEQVRINAAIHEYKLTELGLSIATNKNT